MGESRRHDPLSRHLQLALGILFCALLRDILLIVWKQGYDAGRKAEMESWAKCGAEADEAVREMGRRG